MVSRYKLRGRREANFTFDLHVGNYKRSYMGFEVRAKAKKKKSFPFELEVVYGGIANFGFEITPRIINHMGFEVEVSPHNRMTAIYQLIEPPTKEWDSFPVQDSYVLSQAPYSSINYGGNNSLVIGESPRGNGIPFVQFDLSSLEQNVRIKKARFRLYYNDYSNMDIELRKVLEPWREYNITYLNAPQSSTHITNQYGNNPQERYIEFDVTDTVAEWVKGIPNNGFCLHSNDPAVMAFRSRETSQPPMLIVDYISTAPINSSKSKMKFEVTPQLEDKSTMGFEAEVISFFRKHPMGFSVFAHDPNHKYTESFGFSVDVSHPNMGFELFVKRKTITPIPFAVSVMEELLDTMGFEVEVPSFNGDKVFGFEITAQQEDKKDFGFEITATRVYKKEKAAFAFEVEAEGIYKKYVDTFGFEVTADEQTRIEDESNMAFMVTPQFKKIKPMAFEVTSDTDIFRGNSYLGFEISVQGTEKSNMGFSVNVTRPDMGFSVHVSDKGESTFGFEVSALKLTISRMGFIASAGVSSEIGFEIEAIASDEGVTSYIYII